MDSEGSLGSLPMDFHHNSKFNICTKGAWWDIKSKTQSKNAGVSGIARPAILLKVGSEKIGLIVISTWNRRARHCFLNLGASTETGICLVAGIASCKSHHLINYMDKDRLVTFCVEGRRERFWKRKYTTDTTDRLQKTWPIIVHLACVGDNAFQTAPVTVFSLDDYQRRQITKKT